jgi:hypothetical protein
MGAQKPAIPVRKRRDFGLAALLSGCSWLVLTPIWIHSSKGGLADRAIEGLFSLPYRVGKHVAHLLFPDHGVNHAIRNNTGYYLGPLMGVGGELVFLMAIFFLAIRVARHMQSGKHHSP